MVDHENARAPRFAWALPVASLAVFAAASLVLFAHGGASPVPGAGPAGKAPERLSFVQEDVPTRQTRIYDTLAMFSLPRAEPVAWSEAPVREVVAAAVVPGPMARTAGAESPAPRRSAAIRPPSRPVELASAALTPRAARPGPVPSLVQPFAVASAAPPAEDPAGQGGSAIEVLGVELPGSRYLPTGREAMRRLAGFGARTREMGADAGSRVSDAFAAVTEVVADTVGLR